MISKRILSEEEKSQKTKDSFEELEIQRAVGLERTQKTQQTKQIAMTRERERLVKKYGPNHERVTRIDRQLKENPKLFRSFEEEAARNPVNTPDPTRNDWMLYGSVRDADQRRLPGLTISLFDAKGSWVRELKYVCTDEKGHFFLKVTDTDGKLSEKFKDKPLYPVVTNVKKEVLHKEEDPLFFAKGRVENREIILSRDMCGTPPENDNDLENEDYLIEGIITDQNKRPLRGLKVKAVDQDFTGENPLGTESVTDAKGYYRIPYKSTDFIIEGKETGGADIIIYVYDPKGKLIHTSEPNRNSPKVCRIDLTVVVGREKNN